MNIKIEIDSVIDLPFLPMQSKVQKIHSWLLEEDRDILFRVKIKPRKFRFKLRIFESQCRTGNFI